MIRLKMKSDVEGIICQFGLNKDKIEMRLYSFKNIL